MKKKLLSGTEEWQFFQDFWHFRQIYYEVESESEFKELMKAGENLITKYANTDFSKFARGLVFEHFGFVEQKWKEKNKS